METVADVLAHIGSRVDPGKGAGSDREGLQIGDPARPVRRVAVCHEVTEAVVAAVEGADVDLLVTYHPLLFTPTTRILAGRSPAGRALRLIGAGTAVAVVHSSFDAALGGTADALAEALGLVDAAGFGPMAPAELVKVVTFVPADSADDVAASLAAAGAGVIGGYAGCSFRAPGVGAFTAGERTHPAVGMSGTVNRVEEVRLEMVAPAVREPEVVAALVAAHPYEEPPFDVYDIRANEGFVGRVGRIEATLLSDFAEAVAIALGGQGMRISGASRGEVRRIAVVPGSGGSLAGRAAAAGADVLVTGDVSHHTVVDALDRGMAVVDPGHAPTERPGMARLVEVVRAVADDVSDFTGLDPTPWR